MSPTPSSSSQGLVIWGRKNSINVMKVLWCCEELGLPFQRKDVGGAFGGLETPEYKARNPNAKVPTLDDNGFLLWESNVIVRYLAHKFGRPGLFPESEEQRWRAEQWMDWMQTTLNPAMFEAFWGLVRTPPAQRDLAKIEGSREKSEAAFRILNSHLAHQEYVAGPAFSMGDIPIGAALYRWNALPLERPGLPSLDAYYQRLQERPGFRTHIMIPLT
ncbi:MAG: glutathione S-transferase family protein [Deltaproteobacteria bacterium]|nr:glutathione S-transferase family protein [Deltaproteobacteria bacterium]